MQTIRVDNSEHVIQVDYDAEREELYVTFATGVYRYRGVPQAVFNGLIAATSKGAYIQRNVKGRFPYERI